MEAQASHGGTRMGDLHPTLLEKILKLTPDESSAAGSLACTNSTYRDIIYTDFIWQGICTRDGLVDFFQGPGANAPSFRVAYQNWRVSFKTYQWRLVKRVKTWFDDMMAWMLVNFPEAISTIRPGASEQQLDVLEQILHVRLPETTRIIYRFFNGQGPSGECVSGGLLGIVGGYKVYGCWTSVYILSIEDVITNAQDERRSILGKEDRNKIMVADSIRSKPFYLDCSDGRLYVMGSSNGGVLMPCAPDEVDVDNLTLDDFHMLRWLEQHLERLREQTIGVRRISYRRIISLIPSSGEFHATAITNGIKVRVSSVFMPENSTARKREFLYSVRISSLADHVQPFPTCQLVERRWRQYVDGQDDPVSTWTAAGVVNELPIVHVGHDEYVYLSTTAVEVDPYVGSMGGEYVFKYIHWSIVNPVDLYYTVTIPRFRLGVPLYIY